MSLYPFIWKTWTDSSFILAPVLHLCLKQRVKNKKEIAARVQERFGLYPKSSRYSFEDSSRPLVIIRAPSVGETRLALLVASNLGSTYNFLICTNTIESAYLIEPYISGNLLHVFTPLDLKPYIIRFLDHWKPSLILHIENEIWPIALLTAKERDIPIGLINGRISDRSWKRYSHLKELFRPIFSSFNFIHPRLEKDKERLLALSASKILNSQNLKRFLAEKENSNVEIDTLLSKLKGRRILLAASTHLSEEEFLLNSLEKNSVDLCILVPRHPLRGKEIAQKFNIKLHSLGETPSSKDRFFIIDKIGVLNHLYKISEKVFIGNSLFSPGGGHNFYEALHHNKAVCIGPYFQNWEDISSYIGKGVTIIETSSDLISWTKNTPKPVNLALTEDMSEILTEIKSVCSSKDETSHEN